MFASSAGIDRHRCTAVKTRVVLARDAQNLPDTDDAIAILRDHIRA
jgi:hypothetical protein